MTADTAAPFGLARIGQIAVVVHDLPRAVAFYRDVLGMRLLFQAPPGMAFFDCGGTRLMLSQESAAVPESILYLRVGDIAGTYELLKSRGVEFINAPHMIHKHADGTEEWLCMFKDPEGRPLGLMAQVRIT